MATGTPRTRATKQALIDAVIRLLDRRPVAAVSVKEIAAEAGVNHGLVHRHFGSKEALVREAVRKTSRAVRSEIPAAGQTVKTYQLLRDRPEIARIIARCCLDGPRDLLELAAPPRKKLEGYVAPVRRALERLGLGGAVDPHVLNAAVVSALLGWVVFRPLLEAGYGLPRDAELCFGELARLCDAIADAR